MITEAKHDMRVQNWKTKDFLSLLTVRVAWYKLFTLAVKWARSLLKHTATTNSTCGFLTDVIRQSVRDNS